MEGFDSIVHDEMVSTETTDNYYDFRNIDIIK